MAKGFASIHQRGDTFKGESVYTYYPVVIIGAGESGIAMGCRLKEKLGCDQFRIFERQAGLGGTWWINRYPGIACDVYVLTCFSFVLYINSNEIVQF
jgi:cation diffusion facilitator CzcD-associated flavoprotein CzcO